MMASVGWDWASSPAFEEKEFEAEIAEKMLIHHRDTETQRKPQGCQSIGLGLSSP